MTENASEFVGSIPTNYDTGLGPVIFEDYAIDIADRAATLSPASVLELAAGTGIVSRQLRDRLLPTAALTVTDLNPPMLEIARSKFAADAVSPSSPSLISRVLGFDIRSS
jgi:predicted TPR repeat methyltransferase